MDPSDEDRETADALEAVSTVALKGIAAIEQGDFTLVRGHEGTRALMDRLNKRAAKRAAAKSAAYWANG